MPDAGNTVWVGITRAGILPALHALGELRTTAQPARARSHNFGCYWGANWVIASSIIPRSCSMSTGFFSTFQVPASRARLAPSLPA